MKYNPKKHVKMADLAKELKITYQSMFAKQSRLDIRAIKVLENDKHISVFTKSAASKIRSKTSKPITDTRISLQDVEKKFKVSRNKLLSILKGLKITPIKMRRDEGNRTVPTVSNKSLTRIKKAVSSL